MLDWIVGAGRAGLFVCAAVVGASGCGNDSPGTGTGNPDMAMLPDAAVSHDPHLVEDRSVYNQDDLSQVPEIRLTVTDLDALARVNADEPDASVPVLMKEGSFGASDTTPNGTLKLRGSTSRLATQKSYRIKLASGHPRWRGQKAINLLKNPFDVTRVRNWLAYEYLKTIPNMTSLRQLFVHVYLNDVDLGLYQWVEEPDTLFLQSHGLDPKGIFYKADSFTYEPISPDSFTNPDAAQALTIKGESDPAKLSRMIAAVQDDTNRINDVIDQYFDRDNYETWLALAMLWEDWDSLDRNYMLYSPSWSEKWYILPWDYNDSFAGFTQPGYPEPRRTFVSPGNWWAIALHHRYLNDVKNVASLEARMKSLMASTVTDDKTKKIIDKVHALVRSYVERQPDIDHLDLPDGLTPQQRLDLFEQEYTRLGTRISAAWARYQETVQWPMPVWLDAPTAASGKVTFSWDRSFDVQGDAITYDFRLSRTPAFASGDIVFEKKDLTTTTVDVPAPTTGTYYWQVIARDSADPAQHWQLPTNDCVDTSGNVVGESMRCDALP